MIISRTPFRISFFGGGTDFPAWYLKQGGKVLATSIDKYCYLSVRELPPFFEHRSRISWSKIELVQGVDDIQHPAVREALRFMGISEGVEVHHNADLPARSGIGSSSAFAVGILNALHALKNQFVSKQQLAEEAIYLEQVRLQENVGVQDQLTAAYGGFNLVSFNMNGSMDVRPLTLDPQMMQDLNDHLLLFFTRVSRASSDIQKDFCQDIERKERSLHQMSAMVDEGLGLLCKGDLSAFGRLLHESWMLKRGLTSKVSNDAIDKLYDRGMRAGALGGKILGAGSGGFMLFFAHPSEHPKLMAEFGDLLHVPFRFETRGSQIVFYDPSRRYGRIAGGERR